MVDPKKPAAKPATPTTAAKPAAVSSIAARPSLPSLPPNPDAKLPAPDVQPATPAGDATASEKAADPASTETQATAVPVAASKPAETLAPKLRAKSEIVSALRAGAHVLHTEAGLYRVIEANGTVHPASKRRILALIQQGILKPTEAEKRKYAFDADAEKKASEPKATAVPGTAEPEPSAGSKPEGTK